MFHVFLPGETVAPLDQRPPLPIDLDGMNRRRPQITAGDRTDRRRPHLTDLDKGIVAGLLIGQGHFGGDGKQPQITLKMHVRHEDIFHWLQQRFPQSRLYGPYHHDGRSYYQWMARGAALAEEVLPAIESVLTEQLDRHASGRIGEMKSRYAQFFASRRR